VDKYGGGTDTTIASAISNAKSGDAIFITAGTYNENITIDKSLTLIGAGKASTTVAGVTGSPTINIPTQIHDVYIAHMKVTNAGTASTDRVISNGDTGGMIRYRHHYLDLEISGGDDGIYAEDLYELEIVGCYIHDTNDNGILLSTITQNASIHGNIIKNTADAGVYLYANTRHNVQNNYIYDPATYGINVEGSYIGVNGNTVESSDNHGIYVHGGGAHNTVSNNIVYQAGDAASEYGIYLDGFNLTVTGNVIRDAFSSGIRVGSSNSDLVLVSSNSIFSSGSHGILVSSIIANNISLIGNGIEDSTGYGISIAHTFEPSLILVANNVFSGNSSGSIDGDTVANNIITSGNIVQGDEDLFKIHYFPAAGATSTLDLIELTMDGTQPDTFTGNALHFIVDKSQNTGNFILAEDDSTNIIFRVNEDGNIFTAGYTGLGTTTPLALLTVGSSTPAYLGSANYYNSLYISGLFETGGTGTSTMAGNLDVKGYLNVSGGAATSTFASGISLSEGCFAIDGVCVGGSEYTAFGTDFYTYLSATNTDALSEGSTNKYTQWLENGADIYYLAGSVGIGTTSPDEMLDVTGNISTSRGSGGAFIAYESDPTRMNQIRMGADALGGYFSTNYFTGGSNDMRFLINGGDTEALRIDSPSGFVGIGTTSPYSLDRKSVV